MAVFEKVQEIIVEELGRFRSRFIGFVPSYL